MLKIKEIREKKNITQDEICRLSGIKKSTYLNYENEKNDIPLSKLQDIATALNVSILELFSEERNVSEVNEPKADYYIKKSDPIIEAKNETIEILQREVKDLRSDKIELIKDKEFLKGVPERSYQYKDWECEERIIIITWSVYH